MDEFPKETIQKAQMWANKRNETWLEKEKTKMEQQAKLVSQCLTLVAPTEEKVTAEEYNKKIRKILEDYLGISVSP